MLPEAAGRGQHFQARGHSFSLDGPTFSRQITYLFFPVIKLVTSVGFVYATLSLNRLTRRLQTIRKKSKERTSEYKRRYQTKKVVLKNRFISKYFMLLALSSPVKFSKRVVSELNFVQSLYYKTISVSRCESLEIRLFAVN